MKKIGMILTLMFLALFALSCDLLNPVPEAESTSKYENDPDADPISKWVGRYTNSNGTDIFITLDGDNVNIKGTLANIDYGVMGTIDESVPASWQQNEYTIGKYTISFYGKSISIAFMYNGTKVSTGGMGL